MIKIVFAFQLLVFASNAAVTRVGNGDDGRDLEGFQKLHKGPIVQARSKAIDKLYHFNTAAVRGLGPLIPEVEKSELYIAKKDSRAFWNEKDNRYEADMSGRVYARTFAEPHAATRFFPIAAKLDQDQLIALHIHEGLHRALPPQVRENEEVVSQITLAIVSPDSSYDRIVATVNKYIPPEKPTAAVATATTAGAASAASEEDADSMPSELRYSYRSFSKRDESDKISRYSSLHTIESVIYPLGTSDRPVGLGLALNFAGREDNSTELGPLSLSGRMRLWTGRGFDIGAWGEFNFNATSSPDIRNSAFGRDTFSIGFSARRETHRFYLENILGVTAASQANRKVEDVDYKYSYGPIYNAKIRLGGRTGAFSFGGFGELLVSDGRKVETSNSREETGRFNILSVGPEISYRYEDITTSIFGRTILSRTENTTYDYMGNVFGIGAGEGFIGASLALSL